jgi:DNA-binding CsgD family transcriptional regulator
MKIRLAKALGLFCYIIIICLLFRFDWSLFFRPKPLISVVLGMLLLTACQYRKGFTKDEAVAALRWNVILAGFLTTLFSVFSSPNARLNDIGNLNMTEHLLPLLYASLFYLLIGILYGEKTLNKSDDVLPDALFLESTETAEKVFRSFSLTKRECHVARKLLLQDVSNKEIAAELYISEATVKKHIQNIYQKTSVSDRTAFRNAYYAQARQIK